MHTHGTADHPLTKWRMKQDPPWPVTYTAEKLGTTMTWLSKITSRVSKQRANPELAYAIEVLTKGEVTMRDMLLTQKQQEEIRNRIGNGSTQCLS